MMESEQANKHHANRRHRRHIGLLAGEAANYLRPARVNASGRPVFGEIIKIGS